MVGNSPSRSNANSAKSEINVIAPRLSNLSARYLLLADCAANPGGDHNPLNIPLFNSAKNLFGFTAMA